MTPEDIATKAVKLQANRDIPRAASTVYMFKEAHAFVSPAHASLHKARALVQKAGASPGMHWKGR